MKRIFIFAVAAFSITFTSWSQQTLSLMPNDDVVAMLQTITEENSTITLAPGFYKVSPNPADPSDIFFAPPHGTTIRGAGGGLNPETSTIIDLQFAFSTGIEVNTVDVTIEGMTMMRSVGHIVDLNGVDGASYTTILDVWMFKTFDALFNMDGGTDYYLENCVFGYGGDELLKANDDPAIVVFKNCDVFHGNASIVESEGGSDCVFLNTIFWAGSGVGNDTITEDGGFITLKNTVLWDPVDDGSFIADNDGGMDTSTTILDETIVPADPLYVAAPGFGVSLERMDLRLQSDSPALTAGNTEFDDNYDPIGEVTYAGSQGPAPQAVDAWSVY